MMYIHIYIYMVVSILFTYTRPFTAEKRAEVLFLWHSLERLNGPTFKFPAKPKTVFVRLVFCEF